MKDKYEKLMVKYELPAYEEMVKNFEIDSIGKDDNLIREIMKKMFEKIDFYTRIIESLIQPDSNYGSMKEASGLNLKDQVIVKKLYVDFMYLIRRFTEFGVSYSEDEAGEFIKSIFNEWIKLTPDLKKILEIIKNVWKQQHIVNVDKGYFG